MGLIGNGWGRCGEYEKEVRVRNMGIEVLKKGNMRKWKGNMGMCSTVLS
jgi:hypothetical protein